jgi:ATP/maltotriose-dependent transcriptional regulator MalT/DNA-binding SARP family transcriptional activator
MAGSAPLSSAARVREALLARSEQIGAVPLALVVAPAGSGKSTLLAAWSRRVGERGDATAYLDISPLHGEAPVLLADLLESARHAVPGFGSETALALAREGVAGTEWRALARAWLRDVAKIAQPLVLFLDNFHELPADASGARFLDEVLRVRPPDLAWVVSSRGAVPACVARLRAEGALLEVGRDDLSLRADEVQRLLAEHGAGGDDALAVRLLARTEGWAAGVQLAARRLGRLEPAQRADFVARLGREPDLFGFLAAEVLRDESPEVLAAVDAAALLGRCAPADVAELLGDPRAAEAVARAVERGLLLADGGEVWTHQLWRELITGYAQAQRSPEERGAMLRGAGALLWRRRRYEGALEAFAAAEDWPSLGRALVEAAETWSRDGRIERVRHWLDQLPPGAVDATPALVALHGLTLLRPAPAQALPRFERAMQLYRTRGERRQERMLAGTVGMLHLAELRRDDALRVLRRMISLRGVLTDPAERGAFFGMLAQRRFLTGRFGGALAMAQRAASFPLDPISDWFNGQLLTWIHGLRGEWDVAQDVIARLLARPEVASYPFLHFGARLQRGRLRLMQGDAEGGLDDALAADEAFRDHRLPLVREMAGLAIAHAHARRGDRDEARRWYDEALRRAQERGGAASGPARVQLAADLVRWGEDAEAAREAHRALEALAASGDRWSLFLPTLAGIAIWILARGGDPREAQQLARRHGRALSVPDLRLAHHTLQLALADVAQATGEPAEAERHARASFEFAAREGIRVADPLIGAFVTPHWAEWAVRAGVSPDYALERLAATRPERVAPLLAELARERSADLRERAVHLLARRGGRDAYEGLRSASEDRVARIRAHAAAALARLDLRPPFALRVRSLGGFEVRRGDDPVRADEWKGQTARRLFARLLVADGRPLARERVREDLWPDAEPEAGRNNLRVAITRLNDALDPARPAGAAPHFVVAEGDTLQLRADAVPDWDAARFRALLAESDSAEASRDDVRAFASAREALALYGGPLFPELDDAWLLPLRRELADRFARAAHAIGQKLVRRGRLDEAAALAERLLAEDRADERGFALRMRVALARGDRAGALRSYEEAKTALRGELDLEPGRELQQLAAQARTGG